MKSCKHCKELIVWSHCDGWFHAVSQSESCSWRLDHYLDKAAGRSATKAEPQ